MVFENNVEALVAQRPSEDPMCYICGEQMIPFEILDTNCNDKAGYTDPTMTTWLECCLKRCHEPCLGRRMLQACQIEGHCQGRQRCGCTPYCPDCGAQMSWLTAQSARRAEENSEWFEMSEAAKRGWEFSEFERRRGVRQARNLRNEQKRREEGTDKMLKLRPLEPSKEESWSARRERQRHRQRYEREEYEKKSGELLDQLKLVTRRATDRTRKSTT